MKSSKKNLIIILSRVPDKLDKGDKLRAHHQIKGLSKNFNIYLVCLDTENTKNKSIELSQYCKEIKIFRISKFSIMSNMSQAFLSEKPYQVAYFFNAKIRKQIEEYIRSCKPDHIYAQLVRTAEYVKNIHDVPKTIDYMDAFSKGIERRIHDASWYMKPILKSENQRLLKYESLIYDYFENRTIISEVDREFIFHHERSDIHVIENGIDPGFFDDSNKFENSDNILFTGNMAYPPNTKAGEFINEELASELDEMNFIICGANPESFKKMVPCPNTEITGWVDDIKEYYRKSKIFIAPMFIGTGLQNKLLEAMAMGLPSITTELANKPLRALPEEEILIANSKDEFLAQIKRLNSDQELYQKLSVNGQKFVKKNYSWDESNLKLSQIMMK